MVIQIPAFAPSLLLDMSRLTASEIAELRSTSDLASFVRAKVELQREGKEWKGLCPFHQENTPSFYVVPHKQMFHCFGCKASGDIFAWLKRAEGLDFPAAIERLRGAPPPPGARKISAEKAAADIRRDADDMRLKIIKARKIWDEAKPAHGTLVEKYLINRGIRGIIIPPSLRYHPQLWNTETSTMMPGMVGAVTDKHHRIVGIHRTFLTRDGRKANLQKPKRMYGLCRGAHVCLGLPANGELAIAEGIETALTVMMAKPARAVWAALSLGNMDAPIPSSITELWLCADGDNKDARSAEDILQKAVRCHRQTNQNRVVRIARPDPGKDFNDMVREQHDHTQSSERISHQLQASA